MLGVELNVDGKKISSLDLNYGQLVWLYRDFIKNNNRVPTTKDCSSKNNLPQSRIVNKILSDEGVTYKDFMYMFGKNSHVRANEDDYDVYLKKFIDISNDLGRSLTIKELNTNGYGLPSASWFAKYCPDPSVKTFDDFVIWCGFDSNKLKKDDNTVVNRLIQLEKDLGRPITKNDISFERIGFSMIVINRIWGSLDNCKKQLGLLSSEPIKPKGLDYYKSIVDKIIESHKEMTSRKYISWNDIENNNLGIVVDHKTIMRAFKDGGSDFKLYLESKGLTMNNSSFGFQYLFEDGEKVFSTFEYDLSLFLKNDLNFTYHKDYERDVMYKSFVLYDKKSKINCDYVINIDGLQYYIEVAGIINNDNNDWEYEDYNTRIKNEYRDKMIAKKRILEDNNLRYLFLFPEDFKNNRYRNSVVKFLSLKGDV